ncbi:MAG: neutral/alkaline non-lysosomal ceramidase N-terminal domain-containing protein [Lachnospiraceae bacterium]|nr:neutral/alkaline non-lysosomal ceramidase N-terminal domain-containing protein [Lachnospiraceae bacterium]
MHSEGVLRAGFARADITPSMGGIPLAGYGQTSKRLAADILDRLYAHIIALGNGEETEVLLITCDLVSIPDDLYEKVKKAVHETTGLAEERILVGGTHTHSAPDIRNTEMPSIPKYNEEWPAKIAAEAPYAIEDMKPAQVFYGSEEVGHPGARINFCRHYLLARVEEPDVPVMFCGDNFNDVYSHDTAHYVYCGHQEEADPMVQVICLKRENADDICMINFQAHDHVTGGFTRPDMSSDYSGALVKQLEEKYPHLKCSYFNGAAGNINPHTRMLSDGIPGVTFGARRDHRAYARILAFHVQDVLENGLKESESSVVRLKKRIYTGQIDHTQDHRAETAKEIVERFKKETTLPAISPKFLEECHKLGFNGPFEANAVLRHLAMGTEKSLELNVLRIGDCAFTTNPFEMFNDTAVFIKEHSPFKLTFVKSYSCGASSYLPSKDSPDNSYERNQTLFVRGTAEDIADKVVETLNELAEETGYVSTRG